MESPIFELFYYWKSDYSFQLFVIFVVFENFAKQTTIAKTITTNKTTNLFQSKALPMLPFFRIFFRRVSTIFYQNGCIRPILEILQYSAVFFSRNYWSLPKWEKSFHPPAVCYQLIKVCSFHDRTRINHGKSNRSRNTSLDSLNSRICCKISAPPFRYFFILAHTLLLCMILCIQVTSYDFFLFHTRF